MEYLISSYIIQTGHCSLPSLGTFTIRQSGARNDVANKQIFPSESRVEFSENDQVLSPQLVEYVAGKFDCSGDEAREKIKAWTARVSRDINNGKYCTLPVLGKLCRDEDGNVAFRADAQSGVLLPVKAERVVHAHESHAMLVGDKESSTEEMNTLLRRQEPVVKYKWWIAALMLFLIGLLMLAMYLSGNQPSEYLFGNGSRHAPAATTDTYISK